MPELGNFGLPLTGTRVNLGEARTEPFYRLIEGLERTSFTKGKPSDVADTFFIGSLLVR